MINIQSIGDNKCFKWCLVRYLHPAYHHPAIIRKVDKLFGDKLDIENIELPVKTKDIHKIDNRSLVSLLWWWRGWGGGGECWAEGGGGWGWLGKNVNHHGWTTTSNFKTVSKNEI